MLGGVSLLQCHGITRTGAARPNEDALLVGTGRDPGLFAVADGMGGSRGAAASSIAVGVLAESDPRGSLEGAIRRADREIAASRRGHGRSAGACTTVVALRFSSGTVAEVAHVGDSRAYRLRDGRLERLTEDHSLLAELARNETARSEARAADHPRCNVVTRALGVGGEVRVCRARVGVSPGDRFLLCSDGLSDTVPRGEIARLLGETAGDPRTAALRLVAAAVAAGGLDDVTAVGIDADKPVTPAPHRPASRAGRGGAPWTGG